MNTLIQERHNHSESCITVKVSRRTQIVDIYLASEGSGLAFFSTHLSHIFGRNVGDELRVMLRGKGPHKPEFAYDFMIYTDLIEYNIVGDTKTSLLRFFLFISKLQPGDNVTSGEYMSSQTLSNLQVRSLLKNFFQSFDLDLRDTNGEKIPVVSVGITRFALMLRKVSSIHF